MINLGHMKKRYFIIGLGILVGLLIIVSYIGINIKSNNIMEERYSNLEPIEAEEVMQEFDDNKDDLFWVYGLEDIAKKIDNGESVELTLENIYDIMHHMANTLIIAEDIWGYIRITPKRVNYLIDYIEDNEIDKQENEENEVDQETIEELLEILKRWKVSDFSKGVADHNYVWGKLNGTRGKAVRLR